MIACIALGIPLLIKATPWPIPVRVHHEALWRPWRDASVDLRKIVYEDRSMCAIRDAAINCLSTLGVSFSLEELLAE